MRAVPSSACRVPSEEPWLDVLEAECRRRSQSAVAHELGVSPAMVNQVLKGSYKANTDRMKALVEGAYMGRVVACPVLGELPLNECLGHQDREFAATNPQRVALYRACRHCAKRKP